MNYEQFEEDLKKYLSTPKDWAILNNEERAEALVLSFIGYITRPKNIPKDVLEKCIEVFNNNRGKVENEIEAVFKILNQIK
jgi:hypothetical protein